MMAPPGRFPFLIGLSRIALAWENIWPRLWPLVGVVGVFLAVAFADLLPALPAWLHVLVLVLFLVALMAAATFLRRYRPAEPSVARHRLERNNHLAHRPLTALADRLASGRDDAHATALWQAHRQRMAMAVKSLRVGMPAPGLARHDPRGLRAVVLLVLVVSLAAGWNDPLDRLGRALTPHLFGGASGPVRIEVWITPPAYTGRAPIFLVAGQTPEGIRIAKSGAAPSVEGESGENGPIAVPIGSAVLAQAGGAEVSPVLVVGDRRVEFQPITEGGDGARTHRAETEVADGDRLTVLDGEDILAAWPLRVVPDSAPVADFAAPPGRTQRSHLRIDYLAQDDYGLVEVDALIRRAEEDRPGEAANEGKDEETLRLSLPLSDRGAPEIRGRTIRNLTAHPWAGLSVLVHLVATDGRGQKGESDAFAMVMPERIFNHPVARAIIEQRKRLATPLSAVRRVVALGLAEIAGRPLFYHDDSVVFLALSVATSRLIHDQTDGAIGSVQRLLWDIALRIEDGEISLAERDLRAAQDRLMDALKQGALEEEIERLMDELQQELEKYMAALREQMEKMGRADMNLPSSSRMFAQDDLRRMIERARDLARAGSRDAARQLLSQLRQLLESMRAGMHGAPEAEDANRAKELLDGLRSLTERQQELLDRSFRQLQEQEALGQQGRMPRDGQGQRQGGQGQGKQGDGEGAGMQNDLRRDLGNLMLGIDEFLGEMPRPLGEAEDAMRSAGRALGDGLLDEAVPLQGRAVDALRRATEGVAERMARRLGGLAGMTPGERGRRPSQGRDPFGRSSGGAYGAAVDGPGNIPDEMEMRRAHDILRELHKRAGDLDRPRIELDYIDRLLRRF